MRSSVVEFLIKTIRYLCACNLTSYHEDAFSIARAVCHRKGQKFALSVSFMPVRIVNIEWIMQSLLLVF